ncbi:MAG: ACP S-malonyltransferase [Alphaproteobacteria bacterium]|nr:ACP S-malonyltransferase [Alphaproteobacteria bacterium]
MARALVFPGQGSQAVGMGRALYDAFPAARETFEEVDDALGQNLARLVFEGPGDELTLTENAQPALMAVSLAVVRVLEDEGGVSVAGIAGFVAGHSLGEYSALAAAGALGLADTARLLRRRGLAMQAAVPVGEGAMTALLGLDLDAAVAVADEAGSEGVCEVANDNAPGQVVLSGATAAIERAMELAKEKGAKRALPLPVSAPFHCSLLEPAAEDMAEALAEVTLRAPEPALVANVTAEAVAEPEAIRRLLVEQVTRRVRWRESVLYMKAHEIETLIEIGAGKVLGNLARRINPDLDGVSLLEPDAVGTFLETL